MKIFLAMSNLMILKKVCSARGKLFQVGVRNLSFSRVLRKDHYEVLGVKRDASPAEIKNAYFELSKIYHPDRIAGTDENIAKFRDISAAYEILGNETSRRLYDKGLIGDKRMGIDEPEDPKDPIIQFYKQRQVRSQIPTPGQNVEELEAWTQEFYKSVRKATAEKHELFTARRKIIKTEESKTEFFSLAIIMGAVFVLLIDAHRKNHPVEIFFRELFSN